MRLLVFILGTTKHGLPLAAFFLFAGVMTDSHADGGLSITSPLAIEIDSGSIYTESAPAYAIATNGNNPWFEAYNLPSGFYINRKNGRIYGKTDAPGSYQIPISVTSNFQTVDAILSLNIRKTEERIFLVTNLSNDPDQVGSLPWAVSQGNQSSIPARIKFNIGEQSGKPPYRIVLRERLWISERMVIDGTTQPGYTESPLVQIDVDGLENAFTLMGSDNLHHGASGSIIAGLQIFNFKANALATQPGANNITIRDNYLGFYWDPTRNRWWRNFEATLTDEQIEHDDWPVYNGYTEAVGVGIQSSDNIVEKNVISGVHNGISIGYDFASSWGPACWHNIIKNNYIGTTPNGQHVLTNTEGVENYQPDTDENPFGSPSVWKFFGNNSDGIYLAALAKGTTIANNIASGNFSAGIELLHDTVEQNEIYGNLIGVDVTGEHILPNGELGIIISNGAHNNLVGGRNGANIVAGNYYAGIELGGEKSFRRASYNTVQGNFIGCNLDCTRVLGHQTVGIHLGTFEARMNVIEGNIVVGNEWGVYIDGADDNVIANNFVGVTPNGSVLGNAKAGIVIDKGQWNKVLLNRVHNNGYGVTGHDDWFFGIWNVQSVGNNSFYENIVTHNRTGTNTKDLKLPTGIIVYPTQSILVTCIDLDGTRYRGHFSKLGDQPASPGTLWELNVRSVENIPTEQAPAVCLQFNSGLNIPEHQALAFGNDFTYINLRYSPQNSSNAYYWEQH